MMSSLELEPTICFFCKVPPLHLKRSWLRWHCCLSAWCTWSFVTSETHNSKTDEHAKVLYHAVLSKETSKMGTYCVHFVVFVFSIDVFDVRYNVGVQRLWRGSLLFRTATMENNTKQCYQCVTFFFTFIYLPEKFVVTSEKFKEELQESGGVDEILVPQKNESFAEGLPRGGRIFIMLNWIIALM